MNPGDNSVPVAREETTMPCCLKKTNTVRRFTASVGCKVTLGLRGDEGAGAEIVHIRYAGDELDKEPPFEFTVRSGLNMLVVLVEASSLQSLELIEICGDTEAVLDSYDFDPFNPARGYRIRGS
jgi:hypothetical protein